MTTNKKTAKRSPRKPADCTCINQANKELAKHNTRICLGLSIDFVAGTCHARPMLATEKIDPKRRAPTKKVIGSYCPICGKRYPS